VLNFIYCQVIHGYNQMNLNGKDHADMAREFLNI
jgi:hypothetical protein